MTTRKTAPVGRPREGRDVGIYVRVSHALRERLRAEAKGRGVSVAALVARILELEDACGYEEGAR